MDREQYRQHLHDLSDLELRQECKARILDYRDLPISSKARERAQDLAAICWGVCQDRGLDQIFFLALADVRQEEAERRRINDLPAR